MPDLQIHNFSFAIPETDSTHSGLEEELWENYVRSKDTFSGYALPAWFTIFEKAFGHKTYALTAIEEEQGEKKVVGVLPITHVKSKIFGSLLCSLPFVNYGGIISDTNEVALELTKAAQNLRKELGADSVELRHILSSNLDLPAKAEHKVSMVLDLPENSELLWKSFKDKVRNQVRKSERSGLRLVRGKKELLDDFYSVFCVNMRDLGTPVYAKSFFNLVLEYLPEQTEIICVYLDKLCVASGILYRYGNSMQMPWASSLLSYRNLCINHSLYWTALSLATDEGFTYFDFGRSTPNSGPWSFKKQWGVRELPLCWEYILAENASLPALSNSNPKYQMAIQAWKKLPLFVANFLGPHIVRGIP